MTASKTSMATDDSKAAQRIAGYLKVGVPVGTIVVAGIAGAVQGPALAILVLAGGALIGVIATFWASVRTLFGETPLSGADAYALGAPRTEEEQKQAVLRALKDLEFERSVGKISEEDYKALVAKYRAEAKRLLRILDTEAAPQRAYVEALVAKRLRREGLLEGDGAADDAVDDAADEEDADDSRDERDERDDEDEEIAPPPPTPPAKKKDAAPAKGSDGKKKGRPVPAPAKAKATKKPAAEVKKPAVETEKPAAEAKKPAAEAEKPAEKPAVETEKPTAEVNQPKTSTSGPTCKACGASNDSDAAFCKKCGARLSAVETSPSTSDIGAAKTPNDGAGT